MKNALVLPVLLAASFHVSAQSSEPAPVSMTMTLGASSADTVASTLAGAEGYAGGIDLTAFFALSPEHDPNRPARIHLAGWTSPGALADAMRDIADMGALEAVAMRPFDPEDAYAVTDLVEPGQVLEIAVRDLTAYEDRPAFFSAVGEFVNLLTSQPGVVREYQWLSLDGDTFVGMTVYRDMESFSAISQDPALLESPEAAALFASFPPDIAQYALLDTSD